jgi:hypothetical protein
VLLSVTHAQAAWLAGAVEVIATLGLLLTVFVVL